MQDTTGNFKTTKLFLGNFSEDVQATINGRQTVIITDENVYKHYRDELDFAQIIVLPAGEESKSLTTIEYLTGQLIAKKIHRKSLIIGIGGGVVTDITGYIATIYMRGVSFGFVPTTLLAMVDAAWGGKNGINFGLHKNMLGTFSQPEFIHLDSTYLHTLPDEEWSNGFAEVIKYACLFDEKLLNELSTRNIDYYKSNEGALLQLIYQCAAWKEKIVQEDVTETGQRKLLNFGHTCGHAIEQLHQIPHGQAVSLGMIIACKISEQLHGLSKTNTERVMKALENFGLPVKMQVDVDKVLELVEMDKKRTNDGIDFITLKYPEQPEISRISTDVIRTGLENFNHASSY
jgi:3-dehydroquinate synthase